jgi:hypothetical protein
MRLYLFVERFLIEIVWHVNTKTYSNERENYGAIIKRLHVKSAMRFIGSEKIKKGRATRVASP